MKELSMSTNITEIAICSDCLKPHKITDLCRLEDEPWRNICVKCYKYFQLMKELENSKDACS